MKTCMIKVSEFYRDVRLQERNQLENFSYSSLEGTISKISSIFYNSHTKGDTKLRFSWGGASLGEKPGEPFFLHRGPLFPKYLQFFITRILKEIRSCSSGRQVRLYERH